MPGGRSALARLGRPPEDGEEVIRFLYHFEPCWRPYRCALIWRLSGVPWATESNHPQPAHRFAARASSVLRHREIWAGRVDQPSRPVHRGGAAWASITAYSAVLAGAATPARAARRTSSPSVASSSI